MLPIGLRQYFEALRDGLQALLPPCRVQNKPFLLILQKSIEQEPNITAYDVHHLKAIMAMADHVVFPSIHDVKSACDAESHLIRTYLWFRKAEIRSTLKWAVLLLARHGHLEANLATIEIEFRIWRWVQWFHPIEQGFLVDFIRWLECKAFSLRSILSILREYRKLKGWMRDHSLSSLGDVDNIALQRYLLVRAYDQQNTSKQRILANLRPLFYYYKEAIHGGYTVPDVSVPVRHALGVSVSASGKDIQALWQAIKNHQLPAMAALMLVLVLGHGLPLKALPLLRLGGEPFSLDYWEQLPARKGRSKRIICLEWCFPWLIQLWEAYLAQHPTRQGYLFTSGHGQKRGRPVSVEYCQRQVQAAVKGVLGYPIPVNHLERGALKRLARHKPLAECISLTSETSKGRLTRMMTWLCQH
jgi:integrase